MKPLQWIGVYLIADGIISFFHFKATADATEQFFRIIRSVLGIYLVWKYK